MADPLEWREIIRALLSNALKEAQAGQCTAITTELSDDAVRVSDDGRGLPVHAHPTSGRPLLEVILTGPRRGPKNTLARVNAHSLWLEVETSREGRRWFQRYDMALPAGPIEARGATGLRGTTITCAPVAGEPPTFDELRELVRGATLEVGLRVKLRLRHMREARDETIVVA